MKILAVSDQEVPLIYSTSVAQRFGNIDLVIGCGDLHFYYLEFLVSALNMPVYYVNGNHTHKIEHTSLGERTYPWGATELHQRCLRDRASGLLLAGIEGSLSYNYGPHQYSQSEMWWMVWGLVPALLINQMRYGRYLDVFVTHAPPWKIHDQDDRPHQGIKAFNWLIKVFQPTYHLHGHIHLYRQDARVETQVGATRVVNTYGYRLLEIDRPLRRKR